MATVTFERPGEMNLLGYFLQALVERNLKTEAGARAFQRMRGTVLVGASEMRVTLAFEDGALRIALGEHGRPAARVLGSLDSLLGVALGRGLVGPVLRRRLKVGGRVWRLLPLLGLLRAEAR